MVAEASGRFIRHIRCPEKCILIMLIRYARER